MFVNHFINKYKTLLFQIPPTNISVKMKKVIQQNPGFEAEKIIGKGGFCRVYEGRLRGHKGAVAIKAVIKNEDMIIIEQTERHYSQGKRNIRSDCL